jgi:hypothetical protein
MSRKGENRARDFSGSLLRSRQATCAYSQFFAQTVLLDKLGEVAAKV